MKKSNRKKILVIGYINLNVGDDYFFDILFRRYKNADFYFFPPTVLLEKYIRLFGKYKNVIMYNQDETYLKMREDIPDTTVPLNLFPMICKCAEEADMLINIGGSIFIEADNWRNDDRFILKDKMKEASPSFIIGCNFSPSSDEYKNYYKDWFKSFTDICFRDKVSYNLFKENKNSRLANDIVLITKKHKSFMRLLRRKRVGMSMINIDGRKDINEYNDDYIDYYTKKTKEYISYGYKVDFFSFCYSDGDTIAINKVIDNLTTDERKKITVIEYDGNLKAFLRQFRKCSLIIGSRLHATILAIANNQDFIPISYSTKLDNILNDLDETIEIIKIDGTMCTKLGKEKKYNLKNNVFNSVEQFKVIDQYLKGKE